MKEYACNRIEFMFQNSPFVHFDYKNRWVSIESSEIILYKIKEEKQAKIITNEYKQDNEINIHTIIFR